MIQYKKILMTLALLLTAVTGAWAADVLNIVVSGTSATIMYDGNASNNPYFGGGEWEQNGMTWDEEYTTRPTIKTVTIDGSCKNFSGTSLNSLFTSFSGLTTINGLKNLNTANVQNMKYMFAGCSSLTSLDLSSLNTASVTTMFYMFADCRKLTSLDLSSWNTEKVATISGLFNGCSELTTVDLSSWNTANVWNTYRMFYGCSKLENIYVGDGWSTAEMTSGDDMFTGCSKLPGYDANKVTSAMATLVPEGYLTTKPIATVTWNASTNTGTFNQPGSDVVLTPIYAKAAEFATESTSSGVTLLEPAAAEGVIAGTDAPLIAEGTGIVATTMIGETSTAQGTVMYFASATATEAPALDAANTWSATVPTAKDIADDGAEVKVWYYIQGADTPDGETPTADNTFNDSEVSSLTVTVLSNKFDLTLKAANANTIDANETSKGTVSVKVGTGAAVDKTKAITTNGQLEGIKMGSEVKLNTKAGYKFRKVEVKKTVKTIKIGDQNYTVQKGETWKQFITRNQLSGWSVKPYTDATWCVRKEGISILTLCVRTDGTNWEPLELTSEDAPIDTDKQYTLNIVN